MEQGKRLKPERRLDKVSVVDAALGGVNIQGSGAKLPSWLCFVEFSDYFWVVRLPQLTTIYYIETLGNRVSWTVRCVSPSCKEFLQQHEASMTTPEEKTCLGDRMWPPRTGRETAKMTSLWESCGGPGQGV